MTEPQLDCPHSGWLTYLGCELCELESERDRYREALVAIEQVTPQPDNSRVTRMQKIASDALASKDPS
jgi:hypothetical protein